MGFIIHSRQGYRRAQHWDIATYLGYPDAHYPPEESHGVTVAGTGPKGEATGIRILLMTQAKAKEISPKATKAHRVFAECPGCLKWVPAGRTGQHKCKEG